MATIPRKAIDEYTRGVNAASQAATEMLERALADFDWDRPVEEIRDELIELMDACCESASSMSAEVAAEFYDAAREQAIGQAMGANAESGYSRDATNGSVRAFVQDLVDGKPPESVIKKCKSRIDYVSKAAAGHCVAANTARDRSKPRYARVPSGSETCRFCLMLASRGPVYRSADSAGEGSHWHSSCDCRIVPMWDSHKVVTKSGGVIRRGGTQVEGYDPDAYFERYVQAMLDPDFRTRVRMSAEKASENRVSWSGKFAKQKMRANLSNWQESFAKAKDMDELRAMVSDASAFLDESGMGRAMSHEQWQALRSNLQAARRRLEAIAHESVGAMKRRDNPSSNVILNERRMGRKKYRYHCKDWGLDHRTQEGRDKLLEIITDIIDNAEQTFDGEWRGQPSPCTFYVLGDDFVIVNGDDELVSVLKGGARSVEDGGNKRFNGQRPENRK